MNQTKQKQSQQQNKTKKKNPQKKANNLSLYIKEKKNASLYEIYTSCDVLPAVRFDKINKTGDYRYLLKTDKLPVYNQRRLLPIWDIITAEYDKKSGSYGFKRSYEDRMDLLIEYNRLVGIRQAFVIMRLGKTDSIDMLKYWDVNFVNDVTIDSIMKVKSYILREETRLKLESWRDEQYDDIDKKATGDIIEAMVQAEGILNRTLPDKNKITVSEWLYISKQCDKIIAYRRKKHGHH